MECEQAGDDTQVSQGPACIECAECICCWCVYDAGAPAGKQQWIVAGDDEGANAVVILDEGIVQHRPLVCRLCVAFSREVTCGRQGLLQYAHLHVHKEWQTDVPAVGGNCVILGPVVHMGSVKVNIPCQYPP